MSSAVAETLPVACQAGGKGLPLSSDSRFKGCWKRDKARRRRPLAEGRTSQAAADLRAGATLRTYLNICRRRLLGRCLRESKTIIIPGPVIGVHWAASPGKRKPALWQAQRRFLCPTLQKTCLAHLSGHMSNLWRPDLAARLKELVERVRVS